jgi:hypothetical protein
MGEAELQAGGVLGEIDVANVFQDGEIHSSRRGEESGGKLARVDRLLGQALGGAILEVLKGRVGLERDGEAGEIAQAIEEAGVERQAVGSEGTQRRRIMWIAGCEHAGGSGRGALHGSGAVEYRHSRSACVQLQSEREPDDACAGDYEVIAGGYFHGPVYSLEGKVVKKYQGGLTFWRRSASNTKAKLRE